MAHEMTNKDGSVFTKIPAWHGLGVVVQDAPTPLEALKLAGLDWTVVKTPVQTQSVRTMDMEVADGYNAIRRADTDELFAIMGDGWEPIQNVALAEFASELKAESDGNVLVESAGSIRGGRRVWFLLQGRSVWAGKNDESKSYLLCSNGHDGTLSMSCRPTSIRVVCSNTLHMALAGRAADIRIRHVGDIKDKLAEAKKVLKIFDQSVEQFNAQAQALNAQKMTREELQRFWMDVYSHTINPIPVEVKTEKDEKILADAKVTLSRWAQNFDKDRKATGNDATVWSAFNAVTEWFDHQKTVRAKSDNERPDARIYGKLWGQTADDKNVVFKQALALVK